jgi:transposase
MSEFSNAFETFCRYIQRYRKSYNEINSSHLAGYKKHYKDDYQVLVQNLNNSDIYIENIGSKLIQLYVKIGTETLKSMDTFY